MMIRSVGQKRIFTKNNLKKGEILIGIHPGGRSSSQDLAV